MEKIIALKGGQKFFAVDRGEKATFSLIPFKAVMADVAEGCEMLFQLRDVESLDKDRFMAWIFGKLREKYAGTWPEVWANYLTSPDVEAFLAEVEGSGPIDLMTQIDQIVEDSGFGEEAIS